MTPSLAQPLIALVGVTASGKTALALRLAQALRAEIVGADSRQVYRRMTIGTAKPTAQELATVPHHLVDIVDPDDDFSLARYLELAWAAVGQVRARGRLPLLVGGTGQYLAALLEGWQVPNVPPQPALRAALAALAERDGVGALFARLQAVDPDAARTIEPNNARRIIRALEVYEVSGRPFSAQQLRQPPPDRMLTLQLTLPREQAYARIDARIDAMVTAGLLDEVRSLLQHGYTWQLSSMASLGYIQFRPFFEGTAALGECVQRLKWDTHTFARRQEQWFRRLPNRYELRADAPNLFDDALTLILSNRA